MAVVQRKSRELDSPLMAVNMVEDHIHVAVKIHPKVAVSEWVRQGLSIQEINDRLPDLPERFHWQQGYSVYSFGEKHFVISYIERQKEHHQQQTLEPYLEQIEQPL